MSDDPGARDLATVADDLADTLRDLQAELDSPPEPPRGPLGLPRPPTPREALRFADEVAIPATIAVLEANVKLLEALQRAIRLADAERGARERGTSARRQAVSASKAGLERLERTLDDLQTAVEESDLPSDETARELLRDARRLREEIDDRLREAGEQAAGSRRAGGAERSRVAGEEGVDVTVTDADESDDGVDVDVEGELQSLKDRYGTDGAEDAGSDDRDDDAT